LGVTIRRATLDDLDAVAVLFDRHRQFYENPGSSTISSSLRSIAERARAAR
jgi:hypothetical protein